MKIKNFNYYSTKLLKNFYFHKQRILNFSKKEKTPGIFPESCIFYQINN